MSNPMTNAESISARELRVEADDIDRVLDNVERRLLTLAGISRELSDARMLVQQARTQVRTVARPA